MLPGISIYMCFACSGSYCAFVPGIILAGFNVWLQFVDMDAPCTYRKHHGAFYDVGPQPKTAKQKRAFLASAAAQAWSKTMSRVNVAISFANLGYLDPSGASLRCAPEYKFIPPNLGANDIHQHAQKLEDRIAKAKESSLKCVQYKKQKGSISTNHEFLQKVRGRGGG